MIRLYSDSDLLFGGNLNWPMPDNRYVTSPFGPRYHPVFGDYRMHNGTDFAASTGTPIYAAASGKVIIARWGTGYGNYITIDHGKNQEGLHVVTLYAHCTSLNVKEGDVVVRGKDVIGYVGSTGWSTGPHLHFGYKIGSQWANPMSKLNQ